MIDTTSFLIGTMLNSGESPGPSPEPELPGEYQRVEYLDFTPDAGFLVTVPDYASFIVECASDTTDSGHCAVGYRVRSYTTYDWRVDIANVNNDQSLRFWQKGSNYAYYDSYIPITVGEKMTFRFTIKGSRTNAYIGRYSEYSGEYYGWDGKISKFTARDMYTGELLADFIPCYKKADNTIGVYDVIGNVFYGNLISSGSGAVAKGPDVI